ncbi:retinoic acid receptor gamma-like isoform X2 [Mercenaria mercenaria]|uniref:retinoic acid receptor gamma-like isoform X2 n=1 Tax=Mercenaria mercenaria TaxID=6596 RepID=UPI00234F6097|nr:retinoic acid receptor gamma-like isoform X2 [Mercenaria mercenaria]
MNEELSNILEQALQYASPLPVMSSTENIATDSPEDAGKSNLLLQHTGSSYLEHLCAISMDADEEGTVLLSNSSLNTHQNTHGSQPSHFPLIKSPEENFPDECHSNQGNSFYQLGFANHCIESLDQSNTAFDNREKEFAHIEIHVTEDSVDSDFAQLEPATSLTEIHPDSTSDVINDIHDIADACLRFENESKPSADSTVSTGKDDVKPKVKKRRRREKNPDPPPPPILPPCDICNKTSSGYHYGANTCEACKGFYRRTLKKKEVDYKCKCTPDEKEAWKRGPFQNGCPACRYEKCLEVGMSKNAIKIGRYTLNHKTRNIKKIKSIETIDNLITALTETVSDSSPVSASGLDEEVSRSPSASPVDISELSIGSSSTSLDSFQSINALITSPKETRNPGISLKEIDCIVKTLTEAHTTLIVDDRANIPTETIKKKQDEYLEKYRLKMELFGSMRNITHDEFKEFYNATGIDIDGRLERADTAFKYFEDKIAMVVAFAKAIPGFKELGLDDQANLIKDRCKLEEPEKVDTLQEKMVMCLQHLINIRPGGSGTLLYKIFNIITNLRELTDKEMEYAKNLLVEWPMLNLNSYHLVREFLG